MLIFEIRLNFNILITLVNKSVHNSFEDQQADLPFTQLYNKNFTRFCCNFNNFVIIFSLPFFFNLKGGNLEYYFFFSL